MDPHTAVGVTAAKEHAQSGTKADTAIVCLSTAHPAKFGETVEKCVGGKVDVVKEFEPARKLMEGNAETRVEPVGRALEDVKALIQRVLASNA